MLATSRTEEFRVLAELSSYSTQMPMSQAIWRSHAPFTLTNCLGLPGGRRMAPVISLYMDDHHSEFDLQPMIKTSTAGWLNLTLDDEIACLVSLVAGVRMRSDGRVRRLAVEETGAFARGVPEY
jgi:hypothetical protein